MQDCQGDPEVIIFSTGSEVWVAIEIVKIMKDIKIRVVNLGCWELFDEQDKQYKNSVIGTKTALRVSIEAGITLGWERYTGMDGLNIGIDTFGESGSGKDIANYFSLNPETIAKSIYKKLLNSNN